MTALSFHYDTVSEGGGEGGGDFFRLRLCRAVNQSKETAVRGNGSNGLGGKCEGKLFGKIRLSMVRCQNIVNNNVNRKVWNMGTTNLLFLSREK